MHPGLQREHTHPPPAFPRLIPLSPYQVFKSSPGEHLQMPHGYFEKEIIPFLI